MMKTSDLRDNFDDNVIASVWSDGFVTGSATRTEVSGEARFTLPSSTAGTHLAEHATDGRYDLTGDAVTLNVTTMVATGVAAQAYLSVQLDNSNAFQIIQQSGTIYFRRVVAGVVTDVTASWSSSTHKYWRIRESAGTIFWDTSSNGTSWTNRASVATPFAITALQIRIGATCGNVASPGSFRIDDFNLVGVSISSPWHMTQGQRPQINRFKQITISATGGQFYVATAAAIDTSGNLVSPQYWSGPLSGDGLTLTSQASQAAAQAQAVNMTAGARFDLPTQVEARYIRLYHRSLVAGNSYRLDEYYPRRLVQADDMEAESIRAIHIAVGSITGDRLYATAIDGFVITGATIRTAASGARIVMSASDLTSYDASNVVQVTIAGSTGKLTAGAGAVTLDAQGLTFVGGTGVLNSVKWHSGTDEIGRIYTNLSGGNSLVRLQSFAIGAGTAQITLDTGIYGYSIKSDGNAFVRISSSSGTFKVLGGVSGIAGLEVAHTGSGATVTAHGGYMQAGNTNPAFTANNNPGSFQCDNWFRSYGSTGWYNETYGGGVYMTDSTWVRIYASKKLIADNEIRCQANTGSFPLITLDNNDSGNKTSVIRFMDSGVNQWGVGVDSASNNTQDFFVYDYVAAQTRLQMGTAGNLSIQQKLYIGALGVVPSYLIHLNSDSAGKPGTNTWTISSDARVKDVLGGYAEGLVTLQQLRPIRFRYNGKNGTPSDGREYVGMVAQEVQAVAPAMISSVPGEIDGEPTEILQLDTHNLTYMLLNAVVELAGRVDALEHRPRRTRKAAA